MEEQNRETEIRLQDLWLVFKSCWWQCLIVFVVVAVAFYSALYITHEDEYTAEVSLYVLTVPGMGGEGSENPALSTSAISIANALINDCEVLIKSEEQVLRPVMISQNLDGLVKISELKRMLSVTKEEEARILYLRVTSASAQRSADIANAVSDQACTYFNEGLYNQRLLSVVDHAEVPSHPSNPISMMMVVLVGVMGAVLIYAIYFLKFIMDDKINKPEDVERYLGLSILGVIPNRNDSKRKKSKYGYYYYRYSYTSEGEKIRERQGGSQK